MSIRSDKALAAVKAADRTLTAAGKMARSGDYDFTWAGTERIEIIIRTGKNGIRYRFTGEWDGREWQWDDMGARFIRGLMPNIPEAELIGGAS